MRRNVPTRALAALALAVALPVGAADTDPFGAVDDDGDGWSEADGDCCDTTGTCASPASVNPGAYDFSGNDINDDCDGGVDDAAINCSVTPDITGVTALQLAQAIELCAVTTQNPPLAQRRWGVISTRFLVASYATPSAGQLQDIQDAQTAVLANFGTNVAPRQGATMTALSTGVARDSNDPGYVAPQPGVNHASSVSPAVTFTAPSCPNTPQAFDSVVVELLVRVPTNAFSLAIDQRFYATEFPDRCGTYNDQAHIIVQTAASGLPTLGNIALGRNDLPQAVHFALWDWCLPAPDEACPSGTSEIAGTGYDVAVSGTSAGAATSWVTSSSPVVPGESITLRFTLYEGLDSSNDALFLLDNFRWRGDAVFSDGFE